MIGEMTLGQLAQVTGGALRGSDARFRRLSTDTRSLQGGEAWLALKGECYDGNDYAAEARRGGAVAAILSRPAPDVPLPQLLVADTAAALADAARLNRRRSDARVIALTGSQGKTTVKEMLFAILDLEAPALATAANLNNTIGVPLTLLGLEAGHRFAVIEMGANRPGEIAFSVAAAEPDCALITNASPTHIEGFGSLRGVVKAKGEIIDGVPPAGTIVLNADDPHFRHWHRRAGRRRVAGFSVIEGTSSPRPLDPPPTQLQAAPLFRWLPLKGGAMAPYHSPLEGESARQGRSPPPSRWGVQRSVMYYAADIRSDRDGRVSFTLLSPAGECRVLLNLLGRHNVCNALAAAAAALEMNVTIDSVQRGLATVQPVKGRLQPRPGMGGSLVLDDSYNASPAAFRAAIDVLADLPGRRILLAGDMKELGRGAAAAHRDVGRYAAKAGLDALWAVGEEGTGTVAGFAKAAAKTPSASRGAALSAGASASDSPARHFQSKEEMIEACRAAAGPKTVFLIKGSRGARMDTVADVLCNNAGNDTAAGSDATTPNDTATRAR